jgi:RNA polymerase sigma-70 factor (ECF subfamily)
LTQGFFAELLARNCLRGLAKENGRFRSFLLAALRNFLAEQWDKARAVERGGGRNPLSPDDVTAEEHYRLEAADELSADRIYERRWALTLLDQALARLRGEFAGAGRAELFDVMRQFQGDEPSPATGAAAAARTPRSRRRP